MSGAGIAPCWAGAGGCWASGNIAPQGLTNINYTNGNRPTSIHDTEFSFALKYGFRFARIRQFEFVKSLK
jgi:hypothetical protein